MTEAPAPHSPADLTVPEGACGTRAALHAGLAEFLDDLDAHWHPENDGPFPQFAPA